MTLLVLPVARCRRCGEDRPHRILRLPQVMSCCTCGTWKWRRP